LPKYRYYSFAPSDTNNLPEGKIVGGNAVLSKLPIAQTNITFFAYPYRDDYIATPDNWPKRPRNLQHVEILSDAGVLNVFNFHGVWDIDGDNFSEQRRQMSETILKAIDGKQNVILTGDSNAKETNPAMRAIEQYLQSVFGDEWSTSFNMRRKDNLGYASAVVDHMYVSPEIRVVSKSMPDVDISDHLPLVVELEIYRT
jgi:endonuclease/exonuclease/phosphatase (EEP) superfamily protein YafD